MHTKKRIKIGTAQISNSFSGQNYFPYSVGLLQAFARKHLAEPDNFDFLLPLYSRIPVEKAALRLQDADIIFFSAYVWNMRISLKIAEEIKRKNPGSIVVFGGPSVPDLSEDFLRQNHFVDIACRGEGEIPFLSILENYHTGDWSKVPSASYRDEKGSIARTERCDRISDLNKIPSPYCAGIFEPLMKANPREEWLVLWETNRGCPFSCTFCYWGATIHSKVYSYKLERIFKEIDWFSKNRIEFIYCCDANFGILPQDIEIVKYVARNKEKYGYPKVLSVQNTKNITERSYEIQKIMSNAGLNKGVTLSLQSLNRDTLKSVKRDNVSTEAFHKLQRKFTANNIITYTDIILGLPNETYASFKEGVSHLIEGGQHNRIQFNNLSSLINSEMDDPAYQKKYGLITQKAKIINIHGSLADSGEVYETQKLVVGTASMPKEDWIKARVFGWMAGLLYFDKILQIPMIMLRAATRVSYRELLEIFAEGEIKSPIISGIRSFFIDKAADIQNGGPEYCRSEKWMNIWWPADELIFIKLCAEGELKAFHEEAGQEIMRFLKKRNLELPEGLLEESFYLNYSLMKLPFQNSDSFIQLSYNIYEVYQAVLKGDSIPLEKGLYGYHIDRTSQAWPSWGDWCKKVVWYENKKGAYLYCARASADTGAELNTYKGEFL